MQASNCGRYIVGENIMVTRDKDGRVLSGRVEAIRTVNNRTLVVISYGNRHASFYDDAVTLVYDDSYDDGAYDEDDEFMENADLDFDQSDY